MALLVSFIPSIYFIINYFNLNKRDELEDW